jgi:integrase/recombinase XerD
MQIRFKHLIEDRDRHGNIRIYVRVPGRRKVRIRVPFGTDEFVTAYSAAVSDHVAAPRQARETKSGSLRHLCVLYYSSATFKRLDQATQAWRRRALDAMCAKHGDKPVARMEPRHVRALRDERSDQRGAANTRLKALKALFAWGCEEKPEIAPQNPTLGVRKIKYATDGHHSWAPEEIAQYRERHPLGTKARLALDLLLYTGGRRGDAVRLGPQHVQSARVKFRQAKNQNRNPIDIDIPLHPQLETSIAADPIIGTPHLFSHGV